MIALNCEMCKRRYLVIHDPKVVTKYNPVAVDKHCCSINCEVDAVIEKGNKRRKQEKMMNLSAEKF